MADRGGLHALNVYNGLSGRTGQNTPSENLREFASLSNHDDGTSKPVLFVLKCISALDGYEIEELAREIEPDAYDDLSDNIQNIAEIMREAYGGGTLSGMIGEEYRLNLPEELGDKVTSDIPDFDDPDFFVKLHTDCAPLADRKKLFVRLWNAFELEDKKAFLKRADPHGAFQRTAP